MHKIYANYVSRQGINSHSLSRCTSTENFKFIQYVDFEIFEGVQPPPKPSTGWPFNKYKAKIRCKYYSFSFLQIRYKTLSREMCLLKTAFLPMKILFKKNPFNTLNSGFSEEPPLWSEFHLNMIGLALVTAPKWA